MKLIKPIKKPTKTKTYSWKAGALADGCRQCIKGEKLVLFITGLCSNRCEFCPVSDKKLYKDVIYANERPISSPKGAIEEAKACDAKGAGITGGDPLITIARTVKYIKSLKKEFGKSFHIHLYTPLTLVDKKKLKQLHDAGLDEIRFHPKFNAKSAVDSWEKILLAGKLDWKVGVEIPIIPGDEKEIKKLVSFIRGKVDFLNLNELELADNAVWRKAKEIRTKDSLSYAIKGSDELAKKIIAYSAEKGIRTHYCTTTLKDKVQLAKRILRRAKNIRLPTDKISKEGMLTRGAFYMKGLEPGSGYKKRLESMSAEEKRKILNSLRSLRREIIKTLALKDEEITLDDEKLRLLTSESIVRKVNIDGAVRAVMTEYPTYDSFEVEVELL